MALSRMDEHRVWKSPFGGCNRKEGQRVRSKRLLRLRSTVLACSLAVSLMLHKLSRRFELNLCL